MIIKRPIDPRRLRSLPPRGFGWIDHRLLRDGYFGRLTPQAIALYSLLVCAADSQGLSYYSEARLCALLNMEAALLWSARRELMDTGLLAYQTPLYQLLTIDPKRSAGLCPVARGQDSPSPAPLKRHAAAARQTESPEPQQRPAGNLRAMVEAELNRLGGSV